MSYLARSAAPAQPITGERIPNGFFAFTAAVSEEGKIRAKVASLDKANSHGHIFRRSVFEQPQPVVISDWGHSAALEPWWGGGRAPVGDGIIGLAKDDDGIEVPMLDGFIDKDFPAGGAAYRFARRRGENQHWSIAYYWDGRGEIEEEGLNLIFTSAVVDEASMVLRPADLDTYTHEVAARQAAMQARLQHGATASMLSPEQQLALRLGQEWFSAQHLRGE